MSREKSTDSVKMEEQIDKDKNMQRVLTVQNSIPKNSTLLIRYWKKQYQWLYLRLKPSERSCQGVIMNCLGSGGEADVYLLKNPNSAEKEPVEMCVRFVDPWLRAQHDRLQRYFKYKAKHMPVREIASESDEDVAASYERWYDIDVSSTVKYGDMPIRADQCKRFESTEKGVNILEEIKWRFAKSCFGYSKSKKLKSEELTEMERKAHILFARSYGVASEYSKQIKIQKGNKVVETPIRPVICQEFRYIKGSFEKLTCSIMSVNDAVDFGVQMAEAIVAAQKPQKPRKPAKKTYVLHRDIKPSNIFYETVGGRKIYLLSDYGMARDTDPDSENGPTKQVVFENDNYSAPERKNGKTDITSDIYAVCKCIYRLLCNEEDWKTWSDDSNAITPDTGCSALNNILHGATLDDVKKRRYNDPKVFLNELQNLRINLLRSGEIIYPSEKKNEENSWKPVIPSSDILGLFSYNSPNQEETLVKIKEYGSGRAYLERECDEIIFNPYGVMDSDRTWAYQNYGHLLECGSLTAQEKLGFCDINGIGTIIDRKQGFQRILDSAKKGEDLARLWAGACYYDGCGTDVDLNKAKEYFQNCTIKPQAENCLSICANAIIREGQERDRELQMMAKRGKTRQKTRAKTKSRQVQSQQH